MLSKGVNKISWNTIFLKGILSLLIVLSFELRFYTFYKSIKTLLLTDMLSPPEIMLLVNKKSSMMSGFVNTVNKEKAQVGVLSKNCGYNRELLVPPSVVGLLSGE